MKSYIYSHCSAFAINSNICVRVESWAIVFGYDAKSYGIATAAVRCRCCLPTVLSLSRKQAATWNCTNGVIVTQIESKLETNWNVECVESGTILLHTLTKQMGDKTNASDMGYSKNNNNRNPFRMRKIMRAEIFEHAIFGWENIRWFSLVRVEENGKFNREWLRHSWDKRKSHWLTLHPERQLQMWEFGTFREGKKCQDLANNCHISGILALFPRFFCHQDWKNTPKVYFLNKSNVEWHISVKRWKFPSLEIFSI